MKELVIRQNDAGQRLDKFLSKAVPLLPKSLMYKYIRLKRIKINGKRCEISQRVSAGDIIELYINDEFLDRPERDFMLAPPIVDIVYEDENILVADKKSGLVVHEDDSASPDTLINRILHYLYDKGEYRPDDENSFAPSLCNRLDRNTSGIVLCAKNAPALRILNQKIKDRELSKLYLCVVCGTPISKSAVETAYLEKDEKSRTVRVTASRGRNSKTVVTSYRVIKTRGKLSLCEIDLVTGRTHQIRAHMAYLGTPVLGDGKYGSNVINRSFGVKTQALHAYKIIFKFSTPAGKLEYLNGKEFHTPMPWFVKEFFDDPE